MNKQRVNSNGMAVWVSPFIGPAAITSKQPYTITNDKGFMIARFWLVDDSYWYVLGASVKAVPMPEYVNSYIRAVSFITLEYLKRTRPDPPSTPNSGIKPFPIAPWNGGVQESDTCGGVSIA